MRLQHGGFPVATVATIQRLSTAPNSYSHVLTRVLHRSERSHHHVALKRATLCCARVASRRIVWQDGRDAGGAAEPCRKELDGSEGKTRRERARGAVAITNVGGGKQRAAARGRPRYIGKQWKQARSRHGGRCNVFRARRAQTHKTHKGHTYQNQGEPGYKNHPTFLCSACSWGLMRGHADAWPCGCSAPRGATGHP